LRRNGIELVNLLGLNVPDLPLMERAVIRIAEAIPRRAGILNRS